MFINGYSIALLLSSIAALFLILNASVTGVRVLLYWDGASDSREQIFLESRTWLAALLVEFALILQILSLYLLVAAADSFSEVLVGAMCAAGAFSANEYGLAALAVKLAGVFCYAFWIVLHRLDISSISFPLLRLKFAWLLLLIPLLATDLYLVFQYVRLLEPDIITSCCGVIFGSSGSDGRNLVGPLPVKAVVILFYLLAFTLLYSSWYGLKMKNIEKRDWHPLFCSISGGLWLILFPLALLLITSFVSSYIYGMPNHRCPFDILKKEYNYLGFLLYTVLLVATFSGASAGLITLFQDREGLQQAIAASRNVALKINIVTTSIVLCIVSYYPLVYLWTGGER
jgi:hypothetical protein